MPRSHTIEETIQDRMDRGLLIQFMKEKGLIPMDWEYCSIHVSQESAADEIEFISKRTYAAPKIKENVTTEAREK